MSSPSPESRGTFLASRDKYCSLEELETIYQERKRTMQELLESDQAVTFERIRFLSFLTAEAFNKLLSAVDTPSEAFWQSGRHDYTLTCQLLAKTAVRQPLDAPEILEHLHLGYVRFGIEAGQAAIDEINEKNSNKPLDHSSIQ